MGICVCLNSGDFDDQFGIMMREGYGLVGERKRVFPRDRTSEWEECWCSLRVQSFHLYLNVLGAYNTNL